MFAASKAHTRNPISTKSASSFESAGRAAKVPQAPIADANKRKKWFQRIVTVIFALSRTCGLYPCRWSSFWATGSHRLSPPYLLITGFSIPIIFTANKIALREFLNSFRSSPQQLQHAVFRQHVAKFLLLVETLEPWLFLGKS